MDCNLKGKPTKKEIYKERNFFSKTAIVARLL